MGWTVGWTVGVSCGGELRGELWGCTVRVGAGGRRVSPVVEMFLCCPRVSAYHRKQTSALGVGDWKFGVSPGYRFHRVPGVSSVPETGRLTSSCLQARLEELRASNAR